MRLTLRPSFQFLLEVYEDYIAGATRKSGGNRNPSIDRELHFPSCNLWHWKLGA